MMRKQLKYYGLIMIFMVVTSASMAQQANIAPMISSSSAQYSNGNKSIIGTVGEYTVIGKSGSQYIGSGFYRSNVFVDTISDIQDISNEVVSIFPNPSNGKFTLTSDISQGGVVEVYSITGAKVETRNYASLQRVDIDISQQAKGIYLMKVSNAENVWTQRVIVE